MGLSYGSSWLCQRPSSWKQGLPLSPCWFLFKKTCSFFVDPTKKQKNIQKKELFQENPETSSQTPPVSAKEVPRLLRLLRFGRFLLLLHLPKLGAANGSKRAKSRRFEVVALKSANGCCFGKLLGFEVGNCRITPFFVSLTQQTPHPTPQKMPQTATGCQVRLLALNSQQPTSSKRILRFASSYSSLCFWPNGQEGPVPCTSETFGDTSNQPNNTQPVTPKNIIKYEIFGSVLGLVLRFVILAAVNAKRCDFWMLDEGTATNCLPFCVVKQLHTCFHDDFLVVFGRVNAFS